MFRIPALILLCLALLGSSPSFAAYDPCAANDTGKSTAIISITSATTTALVAGSTGKIVYVCSISLTISQVVTTANIFTLETGTGGACGANAAALTGAFGTGGITAGAPLSVTASYGGSLMQSALGGDICAVTTIGGSGSFMGFITYVKA